MFIIAPSIALHLPVFHIYWIFIRFTLLVFVIFLGPYSTIFCWIDICPHEVWSPELLAVWLHLYRSLICPLFLLWVFLGDLALVDSFVASVWRFSSPCFCSCMVAELQVRMGMVEGLILSPLVCGLSRGCELQFCIWLFIVRYNHFPILNRWLSLLLERWLCLWGASVLVLFELWCQWACQLLSLGFGSLAGSIMDGGGWNLLPWWFRYMCCFLDAFVGMFVVPWVVLCFWCYRCLLWEWGVVPCRVVGQLLLCRVFLCVRFRRSVLGVWFC